MATATVTVRAPCGSVRGVRRTLPDGESLAFRGIPYAAAPVGRLRFAAPARHRGWDGIRDCVSNGPTPSLGPLGQTYSIPEPVVPGEEVLNLNVFTPGTGANLPVYVWIHGGSYVGGSPGGAWFDGAAFNASGIIVVTLTYRLGFEGYGDLPGAPSNRALLDMIAALRWVQENISAFGGNPNRVTLGGQSAGGGAVQALLAAAPARDLFRAAVSHSGPEPDITPAAAAGVGAEMARVCGVEHSRTGWQAVSRERIVAAERTLDATDLFSAVGDLYRSFSRKDPITAFGPILDGDLLPQTRSELVATGADLPLLLGSTSHEYNLATAPLARFLAQGVGAAVLMGMGIRPTLARAYPKAHPQMSPAELLGQAISDRVFRIPAVRTALERSALLLNGSSVPAAPTWLWDFRWRSPVTDRAVHCVDLPFAWKQLQAERVARIAGTEPPATVAEAMHGAIVSFITSHRAPWPAFAADAPTAQVWDAESWVGRDPYRFERIAALLDSPEPTDWHYAAGTAR